MLQLFRVLLPSWKFFDRAVTAPELWYRGSSDGTHFGEWFLGIPKVGTRSWKELWINTDENYLFACHALLEYFEDDRREGADIQVSMELVSNLVRFQMKKNPTHASFTHFQFMVSATQDEKQGFVSEVKIIGEK